MHVVPAVGVQMGGAPGALQGEARLGRHPPGRLVPHGVRTSEPLGPDLGTGQERDEAGRVHGHDHKVVAEIPGVPWITDAVDAAGRHGVGITHKDGCSATRSVLVFDNAILACIGLAGVLHQ